MKLGTIVLEREEVAAIIFNKKVIPIRQLNQVYGTDWENNILEIIKNNQLEELRTWFDSIDKDKLENEVNQVYNLNGVKFGPLYRKPQKIWGIGLNYAEHATDLSEKAPTSIPASFMKATTTIIGHEDDILIPLLSNKTTGEAELGIIIERECKNIEPDRWLDYVAGFTTIIDMTAEDILRQNPRYLTLSKNFDTFFSFGPVLITPDEFENIMNLRVSTVINGKIHASNIISNMQFPPYFLVSFHSKVMTLLPGDIISTGTPGAVKLSHGDVIKCKIDQFTSLKNNVIDLKIKS